MKAFYLKSLAIAIAMLVGNSAFGQDYFELSDASVETVSYMGGGGDKDGDDGKGCDDCGKGGCSGCGILDGLGCGGGHAYGMVEWTLFAYHRADGSRVGSDATGDDVQADFHSSMRYTAGYIAPGGLGIRARYWRFGHSSPSEDNEAGLAPGEALHTRAMNFDVELFEAFELNCNWTVELSGGVRYNEFDELMLDQDGGIQARFNSSDSFGGVGGIEVKRYLPIGKFYMGLRTSILMANDAVRFNGQVAPPDVPRQNIALQDVPRQQIEIFGGWEFERCLDNGSIAFLRVGGEWQHWLNYSSAFDFTTDEDFWDGESNVGFGGFVLGAGLVY